MPDSVCILCGSNDRAVTLYRSTYKQEDLNPRVFSARRRPDRIHGRILRCSACGLVYASPLVDPALLSVLYAHSKFSYGEQEPYIRSTYRRYLRRLTRALGDQPRPLTYLDIGCGNGFMLPVASELGFAEVRGVEPSNDALARADASVQRNITQGLFGRDLLPGSAFDAVSCFQTLDHIPDPAASVAECMRILKPGGAVLFINHNIASLTARLLGERCPMIDIEHTFLHTPSTMRLLFARAGFRDVTVFSVRNDYPLDYWLHLLPLPERLASALVSAAQRAGIARMVIPFWPGNLGLIARKPGV